MSDHKWTPGPWEVEYDPYGVHVIKMGSAIKSPAQHEPQHVIEYEHGCFAEYDDGEPVSDAQLRQFREAEANARLIAAAPDLYEAAQKALDALVWASAASEFQPDGQAHEGWVNIGRTAIEELRAALAKARGEATER